MYIQNGSLRIVPNAACLECLFRGNYGHCRAFLSLWSGLWLPVPQGEIGQGKRRRKTFGWV